MEELSPATCLIIQIATNSNTNRKHSEVHPRS